MLFVSQIFYCIYLECDAGKFGPHCEKVCPYPNYGHLCVLKCNCVEDDCDPSDGCSGKGYIYT